MTKKSVNAVNSRLGNGGSVLNGSLTGTVTHSDRLDGQHRQAGGGGALATVGLEHRVVVNIADNGVPGMTRDSGDRRGK